tara:strand:+ start:896 stop:1762 length:867 start_codon:yes stop_codon:yes gene_type:complete
MTTSLVKYQDSISGAEVELSISEIKKTICPKATDQEAGNFLRLCQYMGLNPFVNDAYLIKYGDGAASMVVGKDAFTKRADAHPQFAGIESGVVVQRGDAEPINRKGTLVLEGERIVGGWARVARSDRKLDVETTVSFGEFSTGRSMWMKMPATMIEKVAIVKSLRTAFPATFSGLYDQAEMGIDMSEDLAPLDSGSPTLVEAVQADSPDPDYVDSQGDARIYINAPASIEVPSDAAAVEVWDADTPHCAEHDEAFEWRVNPDTEQGKYVHGYKYEVEGKTRSGWCVLQ